MGLSPRKPETSPRVFVFLDQAVVSGSGFLSMLLLVRALGLAAYGDFAMLATLGLFVFGLQRALVSHPMMSIGPKQPRAAQGEFFGALFVLQAAFSVVATGGAWIACRALGMVWAGNDLAPFAGAATAMIVARQGAAFFQSYLFTCRRPRRALLLDLVGYGLPLGALAVLAGKEALGVERALWCLAAGHGAAIGLGLAWFGVPRVTPGALRANARRCWGQGRWLGAMTVFQWFASNAFLLAAGTVLGSAAVGAIKAAHNVVGVLHVLFVALDNFVPVDTARAFATAGWRGLRTALRRVLVPGVAVTLAIAAVLVVLAEPILGQLYGAEVDSAMVLALRALALLYVPAFGVTILGFAFRALEDARRLALAHILTALPTLVLAEPLVRHFGFAAAVWGMVAQKVLVLGVLAVVLRVTAHPPRGASPFMPRPSSAAAEPRAAGTRCGR